MSALMMEFCLDPKLAADTFSAGDLPLCRVLLMNDSRYPWVILVPRMDAIREIYQLDGSARQQLIDESCVLGDFLMQYFHGEKLNIGALGNLVPQLHLHHVVRHSGDPAWPGPVWGHSAAQPYDPATQLERCRQLREGLSLAPV